MVTGDNESDHLKPSREYYVIFVAKILCKLRCNVLWGLLFSKHSKFYLKTFFVPCPMLLGSKYRLEPNQTCMSLQLLFHLSAMCVPWQCVHTYEKSDATVISSILHLAIDLLNRIFLHSVSALNIFHSCKQRNTTVLF